MITNAVFITPGEPGLTEKITGCIQECALAEEEYVTFAMVTEDTEVVKKMRKYFESQHYHVTESCVRSTIDDEMHTVFFLKVKWDKTRFTYISDKRKKFQS